jgi:nitrogen fixation/metabolism regulation signal transduction histidine kinase
METRTTPLRLRPLPKPVGRKVDRRINRSDNASTALQLALTTAARRAQLDAVLIVDDHGMLVAQSDTTLDLTMLAAVTPIVGRGKAVPRVRRDGENRGMSVRTIECEGELLYVAGVGGQLFERRREVDMSAAATRRILA